MSTRECTNWELFLFAKELIAINSQICLEHIGYALLAIITMISNLIV